MKILSLSNGTAVIRVAVSRRWKFDDADIRIRITVSSFNVCIFYGTLLFALFRIKLFVVINRKDARIM